MSKRKVPAQLVSHARVASCSSSNKMDDESADFEHVPLFDVELPANGAYPQSLQNGMLQKKILLHMP